MKKIITSFKNLDHKMFWALFLLGFIPTVYTTLRIFFVGQMPDDYSYSIAGQLSWINLIYEIISEAIILPLFYFIGQVINNKKELTNRIKTGLMITGIIYIILAVLIIVFIEPLLRWMAADESIINASATYIRIETVANIFTALFSFTLVALVTIGKQKYLYYLMGLKLLLSPIFDFLLISQYSFSLNLGVNGIGISNIIVNIILLVLSIIILFKENIRIFNREKISFAWMKDFIKIGGISGLESFVRNIAYMLMISRMVNVINEQGTYWVANSFIWGWLVLPITQLGELIKKDCSSDKNAVKNNTPGYMFLTFLICMVWVASIPLWKPFMSYVLQYSDVDKLFSLVLILLGFYILYAFQNVFDATFYGLGKTNYMLFESIVTNSIYYGTAFILYKSGVWQPSLLSIALLFGIGMAFDSIVSFGAYLYLLRKYYKKEII